MDTVLEAYVRRAGAMSRALLDAYGELTQDNVLWAGTPDYSTAIDDTALATVEDFVAAGLNDATLTDAMYALEQVRGALTSALVSLSVLAQV